jgi:V/A-type H+-transporting ATPase subunit B
MNAGIGEGKTRADHREVADQLYAFYARGRELRRLVAIIGEASLSAEDQSFLDFADDFEQSFVAQAGRRSIGETIDEAWRRLAPFSDRQLKRIGTVTLERHRPREKLGVATSQPSPG